MENDPKRRANTSHIPSHSTGTSTAAEPSRTQLGARVMTSNYHKLKVLAATETARLGRNVTVSELVDQALSEFFTKHPSVESGNAAPTQR
jgi:hypothetical protein